MNLPKDILVEALDRGLDMYARDQVSKYGSIHHFAVTLMRFGIIDKSKCRAIKAHYYHSLNPF